MKIMQAFKVLLDDQELCKKAGMSDTNRRQFVFKVNNDMGDNITGDVMRKWLQGAGFKEKSSWTAPKKRKPAVETAGK